MKKLKIIQDRLVSIAVCSWMQCIVTCATFKDLKESDVWVVSAYWPELRESSRNSCLHSLFLHTVDVELLQIIFPFRDSKEHYFKNSPTTNKSYWTQKEGQMSTVLCCTYHTADRHTCRDKWNRRITGGEGQFHTLQLLTCPVAVITMFATSTSHLSSHLIAHLLHIGH